MKFKLLLAILISVIFFTRLVGQNLSGYKNISELIRKSSYEGAFTYHYYENDSTPYTGWVIQENRKTIVVFKTTYSYMHGEYFVYLKGKKTYSLLRYIHFYQGYDLVQCDFELKGEFKGKMNGLYISDESNIINDKTASSAIVNKNCKKNRLTVLHGFYDSSSKIGNFFNRYRYKKIIDQTEYYQKMFTAYSLLELYFPFEIDSLTDLPNAPRQFINFDLAQFNVNATFNIPIAIK